MTSVAPPPRLSRLVLALGVALLLGAFAWQARDLALHTSCTYDERGHLAAGVSYWANGDYRLTTSNLFFSQRFAGLGPWLAGYEFPSKARQAELRGNVDEIGAEYLFRVGHDPVRLLAAARAMNTLLGLGLGLFVFWWARIVFGDLAGLCALGSYALCPPLVANAALVTTDVATALWFSLGVYAYLRLLEAPGIGRAAVAGVCFGLLALTKFSALGFAVVAGALLGWRLLRSPRPTAWPRMALAHAAMILAAWVLIWAFFGFRAAPGAYVRDWSELGPGTWIYRILTTLRDAYVLPEPFLYDCGALRSFAGQRYSFFHGGHYLGGTLGFFPAALLLKTSPAILAAIFLAAALCVAAVFHRPAAAWPAAASAPLWLFAGVFLALAVFSRFNIGLRHLLPLYPPLCILAGGALAWLTLRGRAGRLIAGFLAAVAVGEAASLHGRQHAYFSPLAGGPKAAYLWFIDSTVDWGADLPELAAWQRSVLARDPAARFFTGHLGVHEISAYGVLGAVLNDRQPLENLRGGVYVLSASALTMGYVFQPGPYTVADELAYQTALAGPDTPRRRQLGLARLSAYCRRRPSDERVGDVYFVFRLNDAEVTDALRGPLPPDAPEAPVRRP